MHTIKLYVKDSIYDYIMLLLKRINTKDLQIIEDNTKGNLSEEQKETQAFSNHSASLIEEWKDNSKDDVWK